jgi:hypothetical protein
VDKNLASLKSKLQQDCLYAMNWFELNNMKANASKFQLMYLNTSYENENEILTINYIILHASHSINILGIELDENLNFSSHIDEICNQTGKQVNAMKRIKNYLDKDCKTILYNSYINSSFTYCPIIWMFAGRLNLNKLEKTNKRSLRFVMNKHSSSYEEICSEENQLTIYKKCLKSVALMMYKVKTGTAPEYIKELFISQESPYDMRDNDRYVLPKFRTITYGKKSFKYTNSG